MRLSDLASATVQNGCVPTPSWFAFHRQQFHHWYNTSLYFVLQACSEKLTAERATSLISTGFTEVEKVSHSQCASVTSLAWIHHFESAVGELLASPDFSASILSALQMLAKEKPLLLRLLNHLTNSLNNSDSGNKRPTRLGLAATMAFGQLFTFSDS